MSAYRDPFGELHIALARLSNKNVDALAEVVLNLRKEEESVLVQIEKMGGDPKKPPSEEQARLYHRVFALKRMRLSVENALNEAGLYVYMYGDDTPPSLAFEAGLQPAIECDCECDRPHCGKRHGGYKGPPSCILWIGLQDKEQPKKDEPEEPDR